MNNIKLTTLTPVHIGNGNVLKENIHFVFFSNLHNKPVAILDEKKIFDIVGKDHLDQWMQSIENNKDIRVFLRDFKSNLKPEDIGRRVVSVKEGAKEELYEHIHNVQLQPYLPGSSLKGTIRTAVLSELILQNTNFVNNKNNLGKEIYNKFKKQKEFVYNDNTIQRHFFADDHYKEQQQQQQHKDFFRFLHTGDAVFNTTEVIMVYSYNLVNTNWDIKDRACQWTECIPAKQSTTLRTNFLDKTLLDERFKDKKVQNQIKTFIGQNYNNISAQNLLTIINKHTMRLLKKELEFLQQYDRRNTLSIYKQQIEYLLEQTQNCTNNECILRIGKHSGYQFITGGWQEEALNDNLWLDLKNAVRKGRYTQFPLPKTRRFTRNGEPLGFVKLSLTR